jgi:autotransporter-associated beta strand protein
MQSSSSGFHPGFIPPVPRPRGSLLAWALGFASALLPVSAQTTSVAWSNAAGGSWSLASNWSGGVIAGSSSRTADFSALNLSSTPTVNLDGARTIGGLVFGDTTPSHGWILATGTGGPLTLATANSQAPEIRVKDVAAGTTINAVLAGTLGMRKTGPGLLKLGGLNSYTGSTVVAEGTLELAARSGGSGTLASQSLIIQEGASVTATIANALGYSGTSWVRTLTINRNASFVTTALNADMGWGLAIGLQGGTLESRGTGARICAGGTSTVNVLASDRTATIRGEFRLRESNPNNRVPFTVAAGSAGSTHYPDLLVTDAVTQLNGAFGIEKAGAGTMQLAGVCSFTGPTLVSAGTLVVTGSVAAGSTTTVNAGGSATLAGNGTLQGPVVVNGVLEPGVRGIGTLTVNNTLTLGAASQTRMEISKTAGGLAADVVSGVTTLTMGGTLTVALKDGGEPLVHGDSFTLFSATTRSGAFASVVLPTLPPGYGWDTTALATQGRIVVWAPYNPADLGISPTTDQLDVGFGQTLAVTRTLSNANAQLPAQWVAFAPPSVANTVPLADSHAALVARESLFTDVIADRYRFSGGDTGSGISDSSLTSFPIYPRITYVPNAASPWASYEISLANTAGAIASSGDSGGGAQPYFTRKGDGFWGMTADLVRCSRLNLSYYWPAAPVSSVSTLSHGGVQWKVFLFKDRPSSHALHQIIITPDDPAIVRPASDTGFTVSGLPAACRVHCLVFAKTGTAHYDDATCLKVAKGWLAAAAAPAKWLGLPALTGSAPAGQNTPFVLQPDATGLAPGSHLARWTVAHKDFDIWTLPEADFGTTTLQVGNAGFAIDRSLVELSPSIGAVPSPQRIHLTAGDGGSLAEPLLTSSHSWVVPSVSENRPEEVDLTFDTRALPAGTHQAKVTITLGSTRQTVVVKLTVAALQVTRLVSHPWRNRVYGIHRSGTASGSLLVIDPADATILRVLPLGPWTTDLAIDADGTTLYALGTGEGRIRRFDLDRLVELDSRVIPGWTNSTEPATLPQLLVGPTGLLYFQGTEAQPALRVFDYPNGTVLQTLRPYPSAGVSSFCHDPANNRLIVATCNTWSSQVNAAIFAFALEADGNLGAASGDINEAAIVVPESPSGARLLAAPDGGPLYFRGSPVDRGTLARTSPAFTSRVLALSGNGKVLATEAAILRAEDAGSLLALGATLPVVTFSADQRRLLGFDSTTNTLKVVDLTSLAGILGNATVPADGSDAYDGTLAWEPVKDAASYQVYLSAHEGSLRQVGGARPAESLKVASVTDNHLVVPAALSPGSRWFWRADPITLDGIGVGTVRSFTVPAAFPAARELRFDVVRGLAESRRSVSIARAPAAPAWTASSDQPWLTTAGEGGTLEVVVRPSALAAGWYRGNVRVQCNGTTASIPVTLRVRVPKITLVRSDPALSRVYAVHEDSVDDPAHGGQVLAIDPVTSTITGQGGAGRTVTSLAVHVADDRLYLTNWRTGGLVALDRSTLVEEQRWAFPRVLGSGLTSEDACRVAAGGPGRVMVEGADQTVAVRWFDTITGTIVSQSRLSAGNGCFAPGGLTYFHGVMNSSYALQKYGLSGGSLALLKSGEPTTKLTYSAPLVSLVVSSDGSRVFWHGTAFTDDLVEINRYGQVVHDCSSDGAFAVTPTRIVDTASAVTLFTHPFTTDLLAVSNPSRKLVAFRAAPAVGEAMFQVTDLQTTLAPGAVEPSSPVTNGAVVNGTLGSLSWTADPLAKSYRVFLGEDTSAVAAAVAGSALQIASGPATTAALPTALVPGRTYYWRVDRIGHYATDTGDVRSFTVAPVVLSQAAMTLEQPIQVKVPRTTLGVTAPTVTSWQATTANAWIKLVSASGSTPANLSFDIDTTGLAAGTHSGVVRVTAGGRTLDHPVTLKLLATRYTRIVADPTLSWLYAINQAAISATDPAHLVVIDAATGNALSSVAVGSSVTDLAVHATDNRIYLTNWHGGKLLALNRTTLAIDRQYTFGVPYSGTDAYLVAAGAPGRVMVEAADQWINIQLLDTASGAILGKTPFPSRQGGGEFDPTGRTYWHGDDNISDASLDKFDVVASPIALTASLRPATLLGYYGSRTVTVSGDGNRIFWNGNMFDTTPVSLWYLGSDVFACNTSGSRALGTNALFDTVAKSTLMTLPRTATDGAWSPVADRWFYLSGGLLYSFTSPAPAGAAVLNVAGAAVPAQAMFLPVTDCRVADGAFVLRFRRSADDTAASVLESSTDLLQWDPLPEQPMSVLSNDADGETIEAVVPLDGARRFFRVRRQ